MSGNPDFYTPKDLLAQYGDFELSIINQKDAKVSNLEEPFGTTGNLNRINNAYWIKSETLGQAFKICKNSRTVIEYETR